MVWQPTGGHTPMDQEIRVGSQRPTMEVNPLLTHPELGTVKKILFNNPPKDKVFGFTPPKDPEGAREVMMIWKGHQASPSQDVTKPSPDFKTLNKMAVTNGLSDAKDLPFFRKMHPDVLIKSGNEPRSSSATRRSALPSIPPTKASSTFGMPSAHRSAEVIRSFGPEEPPVKYLVQGAYQDEWVRKNLEAEVSGGSRQRPYIPPQPTKAALGHSLGAARYLQPPNDDEPWKMNKFKTVDPRVTKYTGGSVIRHHKSTAPVAEIAADTVEAVAGA